MNTTRPKPTSSAGFTIMEIIVVVLIILLLMAIIIPSLQLARRNAQTVATQALLNSITTGIEEYYNTPEFKGTFPPSTPFSYGGTIPNPRGRRALREEMC